jgi:RNA polymerase sigma-70 factor (ECF subfamily)
VVATELTDEELVFRTLAGEQDAFALLVRRHRRAALARALGLLGDPAEADDIAQDAFVHAYEQLATCRHPSRFASWLLTIVHRQSLNRLRTIRRRRLVPLDETIPAERTDAPVRELERADLRARLLSALSRLAPIQREIVLLADVEHWSHDRIARATGVSVLMSRRHLSDARRRLRDLLSSSSLE